MGHFIRLFLLFMVSFAIGCGDQRTLDNERVGVSISKLILSNGIAYPMSSMTSWSNYNFGACGTGQYTTGKCHTGSDIMALADTPVYAIADGVVVSLSNNGNDPNPKNGKCSSGWGYDYYHATRNPTGINKCNFAILVQHLDASGQPFISLYGHLRYDSNIHKGSTFEAGKPIGKIGGFYEVDGRYAFGSSGNDDHLHWGIVPNKTLPTEGFGMMSCSLIQEQSSTLPSGCSSGGFVAPGTFISQHFPASTPYSHTDPPVVCSNQPTGSASSNWLYTCSQKTDFVEGNQVWVLSRLYDVTANHQFKVKAYKNEAFQWDWAPSMNTVGSGGWQYSHFWPSLSNATQGEWRFDLFVIPQYGPEMFTGSAKFTVHPTGWVHAAGSGSTNYSYDDNGYTCLGPIIGGENTNWIYNCGIPRSSFQQGDTVYGLVRIDNITSNFRFSSDVYKDGVYQWNYTTGWNDVGQWGWARNYFWPITQNAQPGNWQYRISVDDGNGFRNIDNLNFVVTPYMVPFQYSGNLTTCSGSVTGGAETNWEYTCQNPTSAFNSGQTVNGLIRIDDIYADFRWKEEVYINGTYQWNYITNWNDVGQWGWGWTYFMLTTPSVWPGNWEYRIYLDSGSGFQYLDSAYFTVN